MFNELFRELMETDTRSTRSRGGRGRAKGIPIRGGRGKGLLVRRASTTSSVAVTEGGVQTYARRGSSSSNPIAQDDTPLLPREPSFDDDGNLLSHSEGEDENPTTYASEEDDSSENSLDEHSESDEGEDDDPPSDCNLSL